MTLAGDVPWDHLEPDVVNWLAEEALLTVITHRFFDDGPYRMPMRSGECISVPMAIPASNIAAVADVEALLDRTDVVPDMLDWNAFSIAAPRT